MSIKLCKLTGNSFDLLNSDTETNTSLIRNSNQVKISYNDNKLIQFIKNDVATTQVGTLLITSGNVLIPTGDSLSSKSVAKLLSVPDSETESKTLADGRVVHLLPIQIL
jgi:hypothetical protein